MKWEELKKNSDGMVPVIVQDDTTNEVLMLAYMNEEAYEKTKETGWMTYWSRSRNEIWVKGFLASAQADGNHQACGYLEQYIIYISNILCHVF